MGFLRSSTWSTNPELDAILAGTLRRVYSETISAEYEKRIAKISPKVSRKLAKLGGTPVALVLGCGEGRGWHLISTQHLFRIDGDTALALKDIVSVDVKTLDGYYLVFSLTSDYTPDRYTANSLHHVGFSSLDQANRFRDILKSEKSLQTRPSSRWIPTLFPDYFVAILQDTGNPANSQNGPAVVELVAVMLSSVAKSWFRRRSDSDAERRWSELFDGGGDIERVLNVVDDMVDFLLEWRPDCEPAVDRCLKEIHTHLVGPGSQLRRYPGDLPFGMAYNEMDWLARMT